MKRMFKEVLRAQMFWLLGSFAGLSQQQYTHKVEVSKRHSHNTIAAFGVLQGGFAHTLPASPLTCSAALLPLMTRLI